MKRIKQFWIIQCHLMCHSNLEIVNASHGTPCSASSHLDLSLLKSLLNL